MACGDGGLQCIWPARTAERLGAGESGSGLLLADETTEPGIHMVARRAGTKERPNTTRIALTGADGKPRVIEP